MAKKNVNTNEDTKKRARKGTAASPRSAASPQVPAEAVPPAPAAAETGAVDGSVDGAPANSVPGSGGPSALTMTTFATGAGTLSLEQPPSVIVEVRIDINKLDADQLAKLGRFLSDVPNNYLVLAVAKSPFGGP